MSKVTAVEWLVREINQKIDFISMDKWDIIRDIVNQAKAMEKKQMADAQSYAISNADMSNNRGYFDCEKYYYGTYAGNGSELGNSLEWNGEVTQGRNHIVDTNEMIKHIVDANEMVSEDEVFKQSIKEMEEWYGSGCDSEIDAYFRGAMWMKKQLKKHL